MNEVTKDKPVDNMAIKQFGEDQELRNELLRIYKSEFINTPFAQRFEAFLNNLRKERRFGIVGAYTRNGKTWCIKDIVQNSGAYKRFGGDSRIPVIAIRAADTVNDMIVSLCRSFGKMPNSRIYILKNWLFENIPLLGVEQIIIDDAHELTLNHFKFIKELTDTLEVERNYTPSVVLSSITSSKSIGVYRKIINYSTEDWMQQFFERFRLAREVEGHTEEETGSILYTYEHLYKPLLPDIKLTEYTRNIFGWLTNTELDSNHTNRVAMEHLSKLIYNAAKLAALDLKIKNIPLDLLHHVYEVFLTGKDRLYSTENEPVYKPKNVKETEEKVASAL